jgi:sugar phosphate permease
LQRRHAAIVTSGGEKTDMTAIIGLPQRKRWRVEPRYQIVFACFLATFAMYVERVGFSIAFTAMAKEAALDESSKGTVLSAFFWGYAVSQVGMDLRSWSQL